MAEINKVFQSIRVRESGSSNLSLRDGQVVSGRIMKFFPDQKAMVRIGQQQVVAQLSANLQANQNYLMQVNQTSPYIHLQVVSEEVVRTPNDAARALLEATGQQAGRQQQMMLAGFIRDQLPVTQQNVSNLLQLAQLGSDNSDTVLREMLSRNFPLTEQTFRAVDQRINQPMSFNQTVSQMQSQLAQNSSLTNEQAQLSLYLNAVNGRGQPNQQIMAHLTHQILTEIGRGSDTTFQLLQKAGIVSSQVSYNQWANTWSSWAQTNQVSFQLGTNGLQTQNFNLPFNMTSQGIQDGLANLANNQLTGGERSQKLLSRFINQLSSLQGGSADRLNFMANFSQSTVFNQVQNNLPPAQQQMMQQVAQMLQQNQVSSLQQLLSSEQGEQLVRNLTQLLSNQVDQQQFRALNLWQSVLTQPAPSNNMAQVMQQLQSFMNLTQHEAMARAQDYPTMQTLLTATSSQLGNPEAFQQMNQMLQGIHLSLQDSSREWMQFSAHFPKEMFGLNEDLWMDFEGQKQSDGSIHPKNCRVMFYLNLPNLNDMIIDMHVKYGDVSLSIFHESPQVLSPLVDNMKSMLNINLDQKGYDLQSIDVKPLKEEVVESISNNEVDQTQLSYKGVDFRV
ncbi:hypothetical protein J2R98_000408 [Alkalibacillus filiformis]|uniref:Hook-length control protein FliK n=1 Tax=Alkalibacillus filiformis TaxID=200990 RepID=A0ABU0DQX6_9BACI|nr:hypothetical protein [Alkalibacillus filiformis]MDQ0350605.1 hypothetical protein [Alkalibacillus filiformis]